MNSNHTNDDHICRNRRYSGITNHGCSSESTCKTPITVFHSINTKKVTIKIKAVKTASGYQIALKKVMADIETTTAKKKTYSVSNATTCKVKVPSMPPMNITMPVTLAGCSMTGNRTATVGKKICLEKKIQDQKINCLKTTRDKH